MMQRTWFGMAGSAAVLLALAACGGNEETPAAGASGGYAAVGLRGANIQNEGGVVTAAPAVEGQGYGVQIERGPVVVSFVIETQAEDIRARAFQNRQWIDLPTTGTQTVMLGGEGATSIQVSSRRSPNVVVRVVSVTDCTTAPAGTCTPLAVPAPAASAAQQPASPPADIR